MTWKNLFPRSKIWLMVYKNNYLKKINEGSLSFIDLKTSTGASISIALENMP